MQHNIYIYLYTFQTVIYSSICNIIYTSIYTLSTIQIIVTITIFPDCILQYIFEDVFILLMTNNIIVFTSYRKKPNILLLFEYNHHSVHGRR